MNKKILLGALIIFMIAQFAYADGFNTSSSGEESQYYRYKTLSGLINYLLSLELFPDGEKTEIYINAKSDNLHRRGHRIRRKVEEDKKIVDNDHK